MKILNYGSLNIDYVYSVEHIVQGGETILSARMQPFCGGKGLNQSVALAKAGAFVFHAGLVGEEGDMLLNVCREAGVNTDYIKTIPGKCGHTIIQVDKKGQNSIILFGGANQMQTKEYVDHVLKNFEKGDFLLLQNEINLLDYIIDQAYERGMKIILNPSPFDEKIRDCNLEKVWLFILNEIEGKQFTGCTDEDGILSRLHEKYPEAKIVLTLGEGGSVYYDGKEKVFQDIFPVEVVDTTAAGDTFTGFFVAGLMEDTSVKEALRIAAKAASVAVSKHGATSSIPTREEAGILA